MLGMGHVEDTTGELVHGKHHEMIWGSIGKCHAPGKGRSPHRYCRKRRLHWPGGLVSTKVGDAIRIAGVSADCGVGYSDEGAPPDDGHSPVFRGITAGAIDEAGQIIAGLKDVECC